MMDLTHMIYSLIVAVTTGAKMDIITAALATLKWNLYDGWAQGGSDSRAETSEGTVLLPHKRSGQLLYANLYK